MYNWDTLVLRKFLLEQGLSKAAIARETGLSRGLIYHLLRTGQVDRDLTVDRPRTTSPLEELRSITAAYAQLATSPRAAVRNLAYLHNDLADPALRRHLLRLSRAARLWYEQRLGDAVAAGELRADADVQPLARSIEVTLRGSFLCWTLYREGSAAGWLREDLDATLRPYLARSDNRTRRRT